MKGVTDQKSGVGNILWFSLVVTLPLFWFGCGNEADTKNVIKIDFSTAREADLSEYFESISYTLLDYSDEVPIVNAYKMLFTENEIIVESRETAAVFIFDREGKVERIIRNYGDGPGEFRIIDGLSIDEDLIRIHADYLKKYLVFDKKGNLVEEGKLNYHGVHLNKPGFNLYFFQHGEGKEKWTFMRVSERDTIGYLPLRSSFEHFYISNDVNGFMVDDFRNKIYYLDPNAYIVQVFDQDGFWQDSLAFDFGKNNYPVHKRIELAKETHVAMDYLRENEVVERIISFFPFRNKFFLSATPSFLKANWIFLDNQYEVLDIISKWNNDIDGMGVRQWSWTCSKEEIVYQLDSRQFYEDYVEAFNGKQIASKTGDVHGFFEKNRDKLKEEKIVLVALKLKP